MKYQIFTLLLLCTNYAMAQEADSSASAYIQSFDDKININLSMNNEVESLALINSATKFFIKPNTSLNFTLNASYKFITANISTAPKFIPGNDDDYLRGKTKSFGLGTSFNFRHFSAEISYSKTKGYFVSNTDDFIPRAKDEPFIQLPDLQYSVYALSLMYSSSNKFSFSSFGFSQSERQLRSAGSFVPVLNFYYTILNDKAAIAASKSANFEMSAGPGYIHTFVLKQKYYATLGLNASIGYLNTRFTDRTVAIPTHNFQDNFITRVDGKIGVGYNAEKFYTGLYVSSGVANYFEDNATVRNENIVTSFRVLVGMRLNAPRILSRYVERVEEKIDDLKK